MKIFNRFFILLLGFCCLTAHVVSAQQSKSSGSSAKSTSGSSTEAGVVQTNSAGYTLGMGDVVEIKVLGETQFDGVYSVDEDGNITPAFAEKPIQASCRTERDVRADVTRVYAKYLKSPQINFRVTEKNSRAKAVINGEVRVPTQVEMLRRVRLLELIQFAGGVDMERVSGSVQLAHTQPLQCPAPDDVPDSQPVLENGNIGFQTFKLSDVMAGKKEANPFIRPGDLVIVNKAEPVYVIGEVRRGDVDLRIPEGGLTLTDAVARHGGISSQAKKKDVRIYRLKEGSTEREMMSYNLVSIKNGKQENPILKPYDIVEVEKAPKSAVQYVTEFLSGTLSNATNVLPTTIIR